jgi:phosphate-selective porin OprO/OprP
VVLFDAYLDVRVRPWLVIRAGKFKTPFSIERLQEEQNLLFIERGVPINLAPDRDIGLTVHGKVASLLDYEVGVLNGVPDNGESDGDFDSHKDAVGRLFVHPLARAGWNALTDFGIGVAATVGSETGTAANPQTPTYVTQGQLTAFTYLVDPTGVNTVLAAGLHTRVSPQMAAYVGPFGLLAEWIWDSQALKKGNTSATLIHRAGQVEATWVLTGERATYTGVFPDRPFTSSGHGLGAYELTARYGELDLDPNTFPTFADPTKSVQRIRAWAVGTNAYFTRNLKLSVNFERSTFLGGFTGSYRAPENALIARFQVSF